MTAQAKLPGTRPPEPELRKRYSAAVKELRQREADCSTLGEALKNRKELEAAAEAHLRSVENRGSGADLADLRLALGARAEARTARAAAASALMDAGKLRKAAEAARAEAGRELLE